MNASSRLCLFVLNLFQSYCSGYAQVVAGPARGPGGNFYGIIFLPSATDAVKLTKVEAFTEERTSIFGAVSAHLTTITLPEEDILIQKLRYHLLTAVVLDPDAGNAPPFWVGGFQSNWQSSPSSNCYWVDASRRLI